MIQTAWHWYLTDTSAGCAYILVLIKCSDNPVTNIGQISNEILIKLFLLLILVVALSSSLPCIARYQLPGDCMKISLSLFSIFPLS